MKLCTPNCAGVGVQLKVVVPGFAPAVGTAGLKLALLGIPVANAIDTLEFNELCAVTTSLNKTPVSIWRIEFCAAVGATKTGAGSATTLIVTEVVVCTPTLSVATKFNTFVVPI